jgi:dodecin
VPHAEPVVAPARRVQSGRDLDIERDGGAAVAVIKTIDLVGVSPQSWRDAAQQALDEAARTIRGITGMEVLDTSCTVSDGHITEYLTHVRISFRIER